MKKPLFAGLWEDPNLWKVVFGLCVRRFSYFHVGAILFQDLELTCTGRVRDDAIYSRQTFQTRPDCSRFLVLFVPAYEVAGLNIATAAKTILDDSFKLSF